MVVGCVLKEDKNGELVVDKEATEKQLRAIFPKTAKTEDELVEEEEKRLRELLGE